MKELSVFTFEAPYREPMRVKGWQFGNPDKKTVAILGALRGNEIQQTYICGRLVQTLKDLEAQGYLSDDLGILIIPCANLFSMNVGSRFWAADHTDINRMFPGYHLGETTQRIADQVFSALQGYEYGLHFSSFYLQGDFIPHVRMINTGYQNEKEAELFGLPYVFLRTPQPYDTTTLNYNWQIWNTKAYSLYSTCTDHIDEESCKTVVDAVLRFLNQKGYSSYDVGPALEPSVQTGSWEQITVLSHAGGIFSLKVKPGDTVAKGDLLAEILNPCTCEILETLTAPCDARIFFVRTAALIGGHEAAVRLAPLSSQAVNP